MGGPDLPGTMAGYGTGGNSSTGYPGTILTEHPKIVCRLEPYHK